MVKVGLIQNSIAAPTTAPLFEQVLFNLLDATLALWNLVCVCRVVSCAVCRVVGRVG